MSLISEAGRKEISQDIASLSPFSPLWPFLSGSSAKPDISNFIPHFHPSTSGQAVRESWEPTLQPFESCAPGIQGAWQKVALRHRTAFPHSRNVQGISAIIPIGSDIIRLEHHLLTHPIVITIDYLFGEKPEKVFG